MMKDTKRAKLRFDFHDRSGIQQELERQAAEGWMLERSGNKWLYRRCQPQKCAFAVTYFPKAVTMDDDPSEELLDFREFCAHTGWELVGSHLNLQIFRNTRENPVPIDTDPVMEVENIHCSMKNVVLRFTRYSILLYVFQLFSQYLSYVGNPVKFLSSGFRITFCCIYAVLHMLSMLRLGIYYRWLFQARKQAQNGVFARTKTMRWLNWITEIAFPLGMLLLFSNSTEFDVAFTLLFVGVVFLTIFLSDSYGTGPVGTAVFALFLLFFLAMIVSPFTPAEGNKESVEVNGEFISLYQDDIPLQVEELLETDYPYFSRELLYESSSPLYSRLQCAQYPLEDDSGKPEIRYTIYDVKLDDLYSWTETQLVATKETDNQHYISADASSWGAITAWQLVTDGAAQNRYLLGYENRFVEIQFNWPPTPEQMAAVGTILGNR